MSYQLEKAVSRLDNVRKVKPILAALRTISLGSWQMARNRTAGLGPYTARLLRLMAIVVPRATRHRGGFRLGRVTLSGRRSDVTESPRARKIVLLVAGSERGLCGRYNKVLVEHLDAYLAALTEDAQVELVALGSRLAREIGLAGHELAQTHALSVTALPSFDLAFGLVVDWLQRYEAHELDAVDVLYNASQGTGTYGATVTRLIPPELPTPPVLETASESSGTTRRPVPDEQIIVAADPVRLYVRIVEQWTATAAYRLLLESAVTEHSARYQLMEAATQNADDLVDELMLAVQSARRQAITREMQELAVGAGLLRND